MDAIGVMREDPLAQAGAMALQSMSGGGEEEQGAIPPVGGGAPAQQYFPAGPAPTPYTSGMVGQHAAFAASVMKKYLEGGSGYG
jgi:hypothetical protein